MYLALLSLVTMASEELDNYYQGESSLVLLPFSTKVSIELASFWAVLSHVDKPEMWSFFLPGLGHEPTARADSPEAASCSGCPKCPSRPTLEHQGPEP